MYVEEENVIWRNHATVLGAEFKPIDYWHSPKISKVYQGINVVFDGYFHATAVDKYSYESFSIRACACFDSNTTFRFKISKNIFSRRWINWIFPKRFKTGDSEFDNLFRLKTNDKVTLGRILEDAETRNLLKSLEEVNLKITIYEGIWGDPLPDGKLELAYYRQGRTINIHELKKLDRLYEKLIHRLISLKIMIPAVKSHEICTMTTPIKKTILIDSPSSKVWQYLTNPNLMKQWMGDPEMKIEIITDWRVGSPFVIKGFHHQQFENKGTILQLEPETIFQYSYLSSLSDLDDTYENHTIITFTLAQKDNQTELTIEVANFPTEVIYKHLEFYWNGTVTLLKNRIEKNKST